MKSERYNNTVGLESPMKNNENRGIKFVSLKYFYEIAAIPAGIRKDFMQKLMKCPVTNKERKNASKRKNIRLLKIIYELIENNNILNWNEKTICRKLSISKRMLYCHKHYLLKGLREMYFGWKEIEAKEFADTGKFKDETDLQIEKAKRMDEIGMRREAKNKFLKLDKKLELQNDFWGGILHIRLIDLIAEYYFDLKNYHKFNLYYIKAKKLIEELSNNNEIKKNPHLLSEITIINKKLLARKATFKTKNDRTILDILSLAEQIYSEAQKINDFKAQVYTLVELGISSQVMENYEKALLYFSKGEQITSENGMENESVAFQTSILIVKFKTGKLKSSEALEKMLALYDNIKHKQMNCHFKKHILFQIFHMLFLSHKKNLYYKIFKDYNSHSILTMGYKYSARMLYFMKFSYYLDLFRIQSIGKTNMTGNRQSSETLVNKNTYSNLEKLEAEVLLNFDKMYVVYFTIESYMHMLEAEIWKGKTLNFEKAMSFIKKIEWLITSRKNILRSYKSSFEILRFCTILIEESKYESSHKLKEKYEQEFKIISEKILKDFKGNIIMAYSILSYAAEQTDCLEFKKIAHDLYRKLMETTESFGELIEEIKNFENEKPIELHQKVSSPTHVNPTAYNYLRLKKNSKYINPF